MNTILFSLVASGASLGYGAFLIWGVLKKSPGDEKMVAIQKAIQEGASAYLKRQNRTVFFVGVVAVLILWKWLGLLVAEGFVVGLALLSLTLFYWWSGDVKSLIGLGFGASLISVFARLGGGIFTKGADVGA